MNNISSIKNCYGCGVCASACHKEAISIGLNAEGFYTPVFDASKCVDCGLCAEVCAFLHDDLAVRNKPKQSYGAWSNNPMVRRRCSSGGVGYELGKYLLNERYKVCGVRYDAQKQRAEHFVATTEQEFMPCIGSKYIQSYTVDGFKSINRREKYLVTGTPCQIDSFRRYIRKFKVEENFILMDFFCHSVPSMLAWKKYLQIVEKKTGPVVYASWRNKFTGWHDSYNIYISGKKHFYNSRLSEGDLFYKLFLWDYCCNPACQKNCKYKYDNSSADIRIGDFWGATYAKNEDGVSSVVAFTDKGNEILKHLDCTFEEHPFEVAAEGQMRKNAGKAQGADTMMKLLKSPNYNIIPIKAIVLYESAVSLFRRICNKLKF